MAGIIPSLIILLIRERGFEPNKWRKDQNFKKNIHQLEVYGDLLTILKTAELRAKREIKRMPNSSHILLVPDDLANMREMFGKYSYLLSDDLQKTYLDMVKIDESFLDIFIIKNGTINANLTSMQKIAQSDYNNIKKMHDDMLCTNLQ